MPSDGLQGVPAPGRIDPEGLAADAVVWLVSTGLLLAAFLLWRSAFRRRRVRARLFAVDEDATASVPEASELDSESWASADIRAVLKRWLRRAGHRGRSAVAIFVALELTLLAFGLAVFFLLRASGLAERAAAVVATLPVMGAGLGVAFQALPWLIGLALASLPIQVVVRQRAGRVGQVEADLPLTIELLATLVEAGLGFESALEEVLAASPDRRPLAEELQLYRLELAAGERRRDALRRLEDRIAIPDVSGFVAALVHAEETGASLAATLRPQARQARRARRERALARAEALPEKLVVPLLVGFLPSLLVWTLGPAFFQLFEMLDAAFR